MAFQVPREGAKLRDMARYKNRFSVPSDSSDKRYTVAFDTAEQAGYWTCSCMGCCTRGTCKHLDRFGLKGRKHGASHPDNQKTLREILRGSRHAAVTAPPRVEATVPKGAESQVQVPRWTEEDISRAAMGFA
jgi:hypothetical protein